MTLCLHSVLKCVSDLKSSGDTRDVGFQLKSGKGVVVKKKKAVRKPIAAAPPQVGGTVRGQKQATWPTVGRKRLNQNEAVTALASQLKAAREQQKISLSSLAVKLDVAPATLIKLEDRSHPVSVAIVLRLAEELGYELTLTKVPKRK